MDDFERILREKIDGMKSILDDLKKSKNTEVSKGHLRVTSSKGRARYYYVNDSERQPNGGTYIRKNEHYRAEKLAQREYEEEMISIVTREYEQLQEWLKKYSERRTWDYYDSLSYYRRILVKPVCLSDERFAYEWEHFPYQGKDFSDDMPEIITERGERVRSKSEKMIADKLYMLGIPYRYECPLYLDGYGTVYPDFQILKLSSRRTIVMEHLGMMDNPEYADKALRKIELYERNGYIPGVNLILTHETSERPLDMRIVSKLLDRVLEA